MKLFDEIKPIYRIDNKMNNILKLELIKKLKSSSINQFGAESRN